MTGEWDIVSPINRKKITREKKNISDKLTSIKSIDPNIQMTNNCPLSTTFKDLPSPRPKLAFEQDNSPFKQSLHID